MAAAEPRQLDPDRLGSYVPRLYRAAYGLCGDRQDAEDLVQDTYEQVLRRPRFLRNDQDLSYLLRVLRNTWTRSLRKHDPVASFASGEDIEAVIDPRGDPGPRAAEAQALYEALHELSPRLRETVVAVDVVGLSYREAARALRTKEGTIMSRLYRGRGQIAVLLGRTDPSAVSQSPTGRGRQDSEAG
jgi:RNA polymerase sigma-70 factor (ECF subfamily)